MRLKSVDRVRTTSSSKGNTNSNATKRDREKSALLKPSGQCGTRGEMERRYNFTELEIQHAAIGRKKKSASGCMRVVCTHLMNLHEVTKGPKLSTKKKSKGKKFSNFRGINDVLTEK